MASESAPNVTDTGNTTENVNGRTKRHRDDEVHEDKEAHKDEEAKETIRSAKTPFQAMIEDFSPFWFTICMNMGVLGIIANRLPWQFAGLQDAITDVFLVSDLFLFIIFSIMMTARLSIFPKSSIRHFSSTFDDLCLCAAPPIAWFTITTLIGTQASNAYWGGHAWTILTVVMWWFGMAWMLTCDFVVVTALIFNGMVAEGKLSPALAVPNVGVVTCAATGAVIVGYSYEVSAGLAVPMIVVSYMLVGLGFFVAMLIYAFIFHKLLTKGFPEGKKIQALVMLAGPTGQTANALVGLAAAAGKDFADYDRGMFLTESAGTSLTTVCVLLALLILGLAYFWMVLAVIGIGSFAIKRELSWSMTWWATIFPLATVNLAWIELAEAMASDAFNALAAGLFVILLIDFFVNTGFTIWYASTGKLLFTRNTDDLAREKAERFGV